MTIDKEQLISLLIEKTGLEHDQVEAQLQELVNRIQQAAKEGKSFEVEGFGTFSMEEGELQFEPNEILQTEINNKYTGMKPIELIGAFKEPEGEEIPDMDNQQDDKDKVWAFDEDATKRKEPAEEPVMETADAEADESEESEKEAAQDLRPTAEEHEQLDEDIVETAETTDADSDDAVAEKPKTDEQAEQEPTKVATTAEDDPIGRFLVAAIAVIAIGIGGWFVYDINFSGGSQQSSQVPSEQRSSDIPAQQTRDTQEEQTPPKQASDQGQPEDQGSSEPDQQLEVINEEGSEAQQATYGLRGTVNEDISGGYTIVVHSLQVEQKAENRRQDLQQAGFRALVNQAIVNGTSYYRVGIGQFKTVEAAQQAIPEIPEGFQGNNFIKRIK